MKRINEKRKMNAYAALRNLQVALSQCDISSKIEVYDKGFYLTAPVWNPEKGKTVRLEFFADTLNNYEIESSAELTDFDYNEVVNTLDSIPDDDE